MAAEFSAARRFAKWRLGSRLAIPRARALTCGFVETEFFDAVSNLIAIEPEQRRCSRLVPAGALQRLHDQLAFEGVEAQAFFRQVQRPCRRASIAANGKVFRREPIGFGKQHRALDRVAQLTNVAGPPVCLQHGHRFGGCTADLLPEFAVEEVDVVVDEQRHVRHTQRNGGSAIGITFKR